MTNLPRFATGKLCFLLKLPLNLTINQDCITSYFLLLTTMTEIDSHRPQYTLEEKENEIILIIMAPLSKPKEAVVVLEKDVLTFECPPYLLKIKLPHPVLDRFSHQAYDNETRTYKIKLRKSFYSQQNNTDEDDFEEVADLDFSEGGKTHVEINESEEKQFYGFANCYSNIFGKLYDEFSEVISLPSPDHIASSERRKLRIKEEDAKWNDDHYLADTMETDHLDSIFQYKPPWVLSPLYDDFNNDEKDILVDLINTSKIAQLSEENIRLSEFQMIDVLFGYAYNKRTTEGDNTVESGWTINKLSSTLSWFEVFQDLKSVFLSCYRRCLIFPLYRNWNLAQMIHKDVVNILKIGSKQLTRCLLEVREIFNESENRYVLNSLYIHDLCNFAYHMTNERCAELSSEVNKTIIKKLEVNTDLPLLELAARLTLEEETKGSGKTNPNVKNIAEKIENLSLGCKNNASGSESDGEESDSSQSSDKD